MDRQVELVPADRVPLSQRAAVMNAAYVDYLVPIHVNQEQMALMDQFYDVVPARSVVARTRREIVGQALLAFRGRQAWISGVGVVPSWRRQGVARAMMEYLLEQARQTGMAEVLLEVIDRNAAAHDLYRSLGLLERRELLNWERRPDADPLPIPEERLRAVPAMDLLRYYPAWHDQPASWQRTERTLRMMAGRLTGYLLEMDGAPAAYCLIAGNDGSLSVMDVGINPAAGLLMPGRLLLQALSARYLGHGFSIINVSVDDSLNRILAAVGFHVTLRQWEMGTRLKSEE